MITYRTAFAGAGVLAVVAVLVLLFTPAARADDAKLLVGLSSEGPFVEQLPTALFTRSGRVVPRDTVAGTFWVRNESEHAARSTVWLVSRGATGQLGKRLAVAVDVGGVRSVGRLPGAASGHCTLATTGPTIASRASMPVDLELAVPDVSGQVGMHQLVSFDVHVVLGEVGPSGTVAVCGAQATADTHSGQAAPQPPGPDPACDVRVVVTSSGTPTCVPTAVAAGAVGAPTVLDALGGTGGAGLWSLLAVTLGTSAVLRAQRRRRTLPRHRAG